MEKAKEVQYRQLIQDVKASYPVYKASRPHESKELYWCEECKEINLWSYWQASLDAEVLLVGQDWGNPWDGTCGDLLEKIRCNSTGPIPDYIADSKNPTDLALIRLFDSIGYDINSPHNKLFFTNFVLGYRTGKISGGFQRKWAKHDSTFFPRLVEIIKPKVILCLGKSTYRAVMKAMGQKIPKGVTRYNTFLESSYNPQESTLSNGQVAYIFALAHCGSFGTMNRNRGSVSSVHDRLELQMGDWARIKAIIHK